jgi:transcriptional regulator with PAS, ATPase and Fis domain
MIFDGGSVARIAIPPGGRLIIGRVAACDAVLDGPRVSRRHASLRAEHGRFTIEDLGSSNGTSINGQAVAAGARVPVAPGEPIHIGDFVLLITPRHAEVTDPEPPEGPVVIAHSPAFAAVLDQLTWVAPSEISVLILGETGVGKDVLARRIHCMSPRRTAPFLRVNCAALTESLLESELFGHERGAFSGAVQAKPGLLETGHGGTLFLDEVGELPERLQPKLLHALETREVTRVGSVLPRRIDVRFVAATNRNLEEEIAGKRFRADLYYRLATFSIEVPALRDRTDDLLPLADELVRDMMRRMSGARPPRIDDDAVALLRAYRWPGNVRELRNVIERALVLGQGKTITPALLPMSIVHPHALASAPPSAGEAHRWSPGEAEERNRIIDALVQAQGNQSRAAKALGISRTTLLHRLDQYRISRPRKRPSAPV